MSIASPSSLRGSFTPAGDIESTLAAGRGENVQEQPDIPS